MYIFGVLTINIQVMKKELTRLPTALLLNEPSEINTKTLKHTKTVVTRRFCISHVQSNATILFVDTSVAGH